MRFHADLHVHSKHSRATSRDCDLEHLAYWARKKGIDVVATGDFTHPVWRAELKDKLVPAESGLYRLLPELERHVAEQLPVACHGPTHFMLSVEISTIYKKGDLTRKIHHLVYMPDFDAVDRFVARLARIGNLNADGRPILGLDSRHLLEITLEASPDAYLVPAHIWTPWFAVLGSRSGFDSIVECYGDLADHIFALETGLSSDPLMNWRISALDRYRLVSNSDAHSPGKLGREATRFDTELSYHAIRHALETGHGFVGTVEFFPEEGKYHLDGHRKCGVRLTPEETKRNTGRCPVCGQPVTVGVMHRVDALADRSEAHVCRPATAGEVSNLVPLPEILSEINGTGPASQAVERNYERLLGKLGAELPILAEIPVEDITRAGSSLLGEAVRRLRAGQVIREAGYDGEYGVIRLFEPAELRHRTAGGLLFEAPLLKREATPKPHVAAAPEEAPPVASREKPPALSHGTLGGLDEAQRAAATIIDGPLLIIAGPGSGKTRILTHRIAHLIADRGVAPERCLAITFTRRAAEEMRERLQRLLPDAASVPIHTFHSLGLSILREHPNAAGLQRGFRVADQAERLALLMVDRSEAKARAALAAISTAKRTGAAPNDAAALRTYQDALALRNWIDFDDLIGLTVQVLADPGLAAHCRDRFGWISVDEFQDLDPQQYRLLTRLAPPPDANLCVIGDPDQAIYGFRGADAECFARFRTDYPNARAVRLARNYRSTGTIVSAASQVMAAPREPDAIVRDMLDRITIHAAPSEAAEAEFVVQTIERLIGGHSFFSIDSGRAQDGREADLSFSDIAVLYRTDAQLPALRQAFARSGLPFKHHAHARLVDLPAVRALLDALMQGEPGDGPLRARVDAVAVTLRADTAHAESIDATLPLLQTLADSCGDDIARFVELAALASEADCWDQRADRISLLTLHAAKGLEFPVVFVVGLEDGVLPLTFGKPDAATLDEERRLFYVGMTRAKDRLFLSRAGKRMWRGRVRSLDASPFLIAIEEELLERSRTSFARRPDDKQLRLL